MRCLCCNKELSGEKEDAGWHIQCVKRFFGTKVLPELHVTIENVVESRGNTYRHMRLMPKGRKPRLVEINGSGDYILKAYHPNSDMSAIREHQMMCMADEIGISTTPGACMIYEGEYYYIFQNVFRQSGQKKMCVQSYEERADFIKQHSARVGLDMTELYLRVLLAERIGNVQPDMEEVLLRQINSDLPEYVLAPIQEFSAEKSTERLEPLEFARYCGISKKAADKMMAYVGEFEFKNF